METSSTKIAVFRARFPQKLGTSESTISGGRILVNQMCIFCPATLPKVPDLHDLRQQTYVYG